MSHFRSPAAATAGPQETPESDSQIHYNESPLLKLQTRLRYCRQSGTDPNQYVASCPGALHEHGDRHPSLMIYETSDGTLLITCKAGCTYQEVMQGAGLEASDLYPDKDPGRRRPIPLARRWDYRALLQQLRFEAEIVENAATKIRRHRLTDDDEQRLQTALLRICRIVEVSE